MKKDNNVVILGGITRLDVPVERIIDAAKAEDLDNIVILGYDKEGNEYFASSIASGPDVVWLFERAKKKLMDIVETNDHDHN